MNDLWDTIGYIRHLFKINKFNLCIYLHNLFVSLGEGGLVCLGNCGLRLWNRSLVFFLNYHSDHTYFKSVHTC